MKARRCAVEVAMEAFPFSVVRPRARVGSAVPHARVAMGLALVAVVSVAACAPSALLSRGGPTTNEASPSSQPPETLSIIMRVEPQNMTDSASNLNRISLALFGAVLGATDSQDVPFPVLSRELPQLNSDTWQVFPDGRMQTTYRLRPGLTWHDGRPLTADDFVFGRRVMEARITWGLSQPSEELRLIEDVQAPDPTTVVIQWRRPFADAAVPSLMPHPRHLLEASLEQGESEAFGSLPYWTTEFVGAGPFRLTRWQQGAFIEGEAFEAYALGRPKIGRVQLTWNGDPNVVATRLLAGAAHVALDSALQFQQAATLRKSWTSDALGSILLSPNQLRHLQVQHRSDYAKPAVMTDVRVRRATLHAIDRQALAEALLEGEGIAADSLVSPTESYYPEVDRVIAKYPYDVRTTEQLMSEVGLRKGADGFFAGAEGRFNPEIRGVAEGQEGQETTIIADYLRRAGMDVALDMVPAAQRAQSDELKATFPGYTTNYNTLSRDPGLSKLATSRVAAPSNRWSGSNKSGWTDAGYDQLYDRWLGALDRAEQNRVMVQIMALVSQELPTLPLYFNFEVVAHVARLHGPQRSAPVATRYANIHEWEFR